MFPSSMQRRFVEHTKSQSSLSWREYRRYLGISNHVHYRYEDCTMPLRVFRKALRVAKISPDEARRFRYRFVKEPMETVLGLKHDASAAELAGACLGDGYLSRYYLAIFGEKLKDTVYLTRHVKQLLQVTLRLTPTLKTNRPDEDFLVLNSAAGTRSLHRLGMPYGDKIKNGARIPKWIYKRKSYLTGCLRGLFDTDGCVYGFRRKAPAKGSKAIISFEFGEGSFLARDVHRALLQLGYAPRMMPHRNECRLAVKEDVVRFMKEIKPANEKHWQSFQRWHGPVV